MTGCSWTHHGWQESKAVFTTYWVVYSTRGMRSNHHIYSASPSVEYKSKRAKKKKKKSPSSLNRVMLFV